MEDSFSQQIQAAYKKIVAAMKLRESERQLEQVMGVIEFMRIQKAIAIIGPVCSGKTQILKIVSQTLKAAYDIIFRTTSVNPMTFSRDELYGPVNAFDSNNEEDIDRALKKKSIFQIILDNYQQEKI